MENNSKEFRKAQRTTIHCTDGNEINIMDDDILREHYEFYTTKGKNHGVGLHLVKRILEVESIYSQSRELFDKYYVQKLIINLEEL